MQAMQVGVFFYLPSILLSGFMFPFHAMPAWARGIGEALPLTHFLRCPRASLLRGADAATALGLAWPVGLFALLALLTAIWGAYRRICTQCKGNNVRPHHHVRFAPWIPHHQQGIAMPASNAT